jgi:N-acetylglutamate synthase-like GNAT family acetyltransferase
MRTDNKAFEKRSLPEDNYFHFANFNKHSDLLNNCIDECNIRVKKTNKYPYNMIKIRLYKKSDQAEIDKMIDSIATEFELPISNPSRANTPLLDKYWVSLHKNEIIGTIGVLKIGGEFSILKKMFVKREYRGKEFRIASLLLNKVFDWCNSQSIDTIYLGTMSQFKAAHKFYEKNGFETISINKLPSSFVTNPIDDVFYKKHIEKS